MTVVRDKGYVGSFCYLALYVNGALATRIDVAEGARFYIEPGEVLLKVGWDPQGQGMCSADGHWTQRETMLRANEEKSFRLTIDSNGKLDIIRGDL